MTEPPDTTSKVWNVDRVALELGISRAYVYRLVSEKRIPHFRVGTALRFDPADLQRWVAGRKIPAVK